MRSTLVLGLFVLFQATACNGPEEPNVDDDDTGTPIVDHPDVDADLDQMTEADGDCDDSNPGVYAGAPELCDGIDNNCNDDVDEGLDRTFYEDHDGDGYGNADAMVTDCMQPEGYLLTAGDCNDRVATIHPDAAEVCDEADVDEDCDDLVDADDPNLTNGRIFWADADGDGYGDAGSTGTRACDDIVGHVTNAYDCDDGNAAVNPNMLEVCDGLAMDDDCDALVDDADPESLKLDYWPDNDSDGFGNVLTPVSHTCFNLLEEGYVLNDQDCDDARPLINPDATEVCNDALVDEDCDGDVDEADSDTTIYSWYVDDDSDGYGLTGSTPVVTCQVVTGSATRAGDCQDDDPAINPGQDELCNPGEDIDEDCDNKIDEADPETPAIDYFTDTDGDGYGDSSTVFSTCDPTVGYVIDGGDCDEGDTTINPGAYDDCSDDIDNDCDGTVDNCSIGEISMNTDADAQIRGSAMSTYAGNNIANVGDINGDGVGDLAISINSYTGFFYYGEVSLMFGPVTGSTTIASSGADITGSTSYNYFGWSVAGDADVDGDGMGDMIAGTYNGGEKAYLYYGPITADDTTTGADATFSGAYSYDYFGVGVDVSGDYDGDGYGEAIVMAPYGERAAGFYSTGAMYVWSAPGTGSLAASTADYIFGGSNSNEMLTYWGNAHARVGDLDGDGFQELAAAAPVLTPSGTTYYSAGRVYLLYGGGSLAAGTYDIAVAADATVSGEAQSTYLGYGIANAADYNFDGYDDLIASGYIASAGGYSYNGATYVFAGPVSGDIGTSDYTAELYGGTNNEYSGERLKAGDFNDDGFSDVLISARNHSTVGCTYCGGAYLALGGVTGSQVLTDAFATILGPTMYASAGQGITFIDDWDGDGRDEVAVSAPYNSPAYDGITAVFTGGSLFP